MEFYKIRAELFPYIHFVDKTVITPPYIHKRRKAGEYIAYFVRSGEMHLMEDSQPVVLTPGDFCILDKERTHEGIKASTCEYYYIHFLHQGLELQGGVDESSMTRMLLEERQSTLKSDIYTYEKCGKQTIWIPKHWNVVNVRDRIKIDELLKHAMEENRFPLENYKALSACRIQEAMIEIARCYTTFQKEQYSCKMPAFYPKVQEIIEWINQDYAKKISSDMLEEKFSQNYDYMNRVFKKITGETIFQYLTRVRISHAKNLILHTSLYMGDIGEKVGFPDEYYFSRVFKKHVGTSPAAYAETVSYENQKVVIG